MTLSLLTKLMPLLLWIRDLIRSNPLTSWLVWKFIQRKHGVSLDRGWLKSFRSGQSIDGNGTPIPWITYKAISFLESLSFPEMSVFEYGCGNSTLWWAKQVQKVTSCEHHQEWYKKVQADVPENVTLLYQPLENGDNYENSILGTGEQYDLIVVDGRRRVRCVDSALKALKDKGTVVLDNSDRSHYAPAIKQLLEAGFTHHEFPGMAPISTLYQKTSVFTRGLPE